MPLLLFSVAVYFALIYGVSYLSSRRSARSDMQSYFLANRSAPWYAIAIGMVGSSISGVTFISVTGSVGVLAKDGHTYKGLGYMQIVFGYFIGYIVIAYVLLPLYYRLNLTSIYGYLGQRFGDKAHKTGAAFFLLSRSLGASARLYLVLSVLQTLIFKELGLPFWVVCLAAMLFILFYTEKGGLQTLVWTDVVQTVVFLVAACLTFAFLMNDLNFSNPFTAIGGSKYGQMFFFDWQKPDHFAKQILSGALIAISMTGLDQDMMQKNLSIRTLTDAQKNLVSYSIVIIFVNLLFVGLGALLYIYAAQHGITPPEKSDYLFPTLALNHFPPYVAVFVLLGLIAAAVNSVDGSLTSLTTSICLDILQIDKRPTKEAMRIRTMTHYGMAAFFFILLIIFNVLPQNKDLNVIDLVLGMATYTYGPLLGMFLFGMVSRRLPDDRFTPVVCVAAPLVCIWLAKYSAEYLGGYKFGLELILVNTALVIIGLTLISSKKHQIRQKE